MTMTNDEYRQKLDNLETLRINKHLKIVIEFLDSAIERLERAGDVEDSTFRNSHRYAAETHIRAALAALEQSR